MGNGELRPPTAPKFLDRSFWNSNLRNTSRGPTNMQNMVLIGIRGWAGRIPSLALFLVLPFVFFVFFAPRPGHTAGPIRRAMAHSTSFPLRKCLLGVSVKTPKTQILERKWTLKPNLRNIWRSYEHIFETMNSIDMKYEQRLPVSSAAYCYNRLYHRRIAQTNLRARHQRALKLVTTIKYIQQKWNPESRNKAHDSPWILGLKIRPGSH